MLHYTATAQQARQLEGLAYWIADLSYTRERTPDDLDEIRRADRTIRYDLDQLDRLGVPFWVQNAAIGWATDWRNTRRQSFRAAMAARLITV